MSHYISLARYVLNVKLPQDTPCGYLKGELFILMELGGDNNVIDPITGTFSRAWHLGKAYFSQCDLMKRVVVDSALCESLMLKMNGRDTKPENYIKAWRTALQAPLDISDLVSQDASAAFMNVTAKVRTSEVSELMSIGNISTILNTKVLDDGLTEVSGFLDMSCSKDILHFCAIGKYCTPQLTLMANIPDNNGLLWKGIKRVMKLNEAAQSA